MLFTKKRFKLLTKSLVLSYLVSLFLALFIKLHVQKYGVNPTFPYLNILLTKVQSVEQAVWAFFDGAHYIRIAEFGYVDVGTQAFFPMYPLILRLFHDLSGLPIITAGRILSILFTGISIYLMRSLFGSHAKHKIFTLLLFPTSFFLFFIYTESLFLTLTLSCFVALKNKNFMIAAIFAGLASATRLVGVFLTFSVLISYLSFHNQIKSPKDWLRAKVVILGLISTSGLIIYLLYLNYLFHDPLIFLKVQSLFGAERETSKLIFFPQVIYRYIKMIFTVDPSSILYQRVWLELGSFIFAIVLVIKNYRRIPLTNQVYILPSLILPTLTGTLSSFPRYFLVLIPFLLILEKPRAYLLYAALCLPLLIYLLSLFSGGQFVS